VSVTRKQYGGDKEYDAIMNLYKFDESLINKSTFYLWFFFKIFEIITSEIPKHKILFKNILEQAYIKYQNPDWIQKKRSFFTTTYTLKNYTNIEAAIWLLLDVKNNNTYLSKLIKNVKEIANYDKRTEDYEIWGLFLQGTNLKIKEFFFGILGEFQLLYCLNNYGNNPQDNMFDIRLFFLDENLTSKPDFEAEIEICVNLRKLVNHWFSFFFPNKTNNLTIKNEYFSDTPNPALSVIRLIWLFVRIIPKDKFNQAHNFVFSLVYFCTLFKIEDRNKFLQNLLNEKLNYIENYRSQLDENQIVIFDYFIDYLKKWFQLNNQKILYDDFLYELEEKKNNTTDVNVTYLQSKNRILDIIISANYNGVIPKEKINEVHFIKYGSFKPFIYKEEETDFKQIDLQKPTIFLDFDNTIGNSTTHLIDPAWLTFLQENKNNYNFVLLTSRGEGYTRKINQLEETNKDLLQLFKCILCEPNEKVSRTDTERAFRKLVNMIHFFTKFSQELSTYIDNDNNNKLHFRKITDALQKIIKVNKLTVIFMDDGLFNIKMIKTFLNEVNIQHAEKDKFKKNLETLKNMLPPVEADSEIRSSYNVVESSLETSGQGPAPEELGKETETPAVAAVAAAPVPETRDATPTSDAKREEFAPVKSQESEGSPSGTSRNISSLSSAESQKNVEETYPENVIEHPTNPGVAAEVFESSTPELSARAAVPQTGNAEYARLQLNTSPTPVYYVPYAFLERTQKNEYNVAHTKQNPQTPTGYSKLKHDEEHVYNVPVAPIVDYAVALKASPNTDTPPLPVNTKPKTLSAQAAENPRYQLLYDAVVRFDPKRETTPNFPNKNVKRTSNPRFPSHKVASPYKNDDVLNLENYDRLKPFAEDNKFITQLDYAIKNYKIRCKKEEISHAEILSDLNSWAIANNIYAKERILAKLQMSCKFNGFELDKNILSDEKFLNTCVEELKNYFIGDDAQAQANNLWQEISLLNCFDVNNFLRTELGMGLPGYTENVVVGNEKNRKPKETLYSVQNVQQYLWEVVNRTDNKLTISFIMPYLLFYYKFSTVIGLNDWFERKKKCNTLNNEKIKMCKNYYMYLLTQPIQSFSNDTFKELKKKEEEEKVNTKQSIQSSDMVFHVMVKLSFANKEEELQDLLKKIQEKLNEKYFPNAAPPILAPGPAAAQPVLAEPTVVKPTRLARLKNWFLGKNKGGKGKQHKRTRRRGFFRRRSTKRTCHRYTKRSKSTKRSQSTKRSKSTRRSQSTKHRPSTKRTKRTKRKRNY
jgi:hypothetical protein